MSRGIFPGRLFSVIGAVVFLLQPPVAFGQIAPDIESVSGQWGACISGLNEVGQVITPPVAGKLYAFDMFVLPAKGQSNVLNVLY